MDSSITHIRPRFKLEIKHEARSIIDKIDLMLREGRPGIKGVIVDDHIILDIENSEIHYWSPQVHFRVEPDEEEDGKSWVSGLIGPRPAVWTLFMFIYFSIGIIGFVISTFGISKWMLGENSHLIWALPITILFMLTAYLSGKYGERLGSDQVELLKDFIREAIHFD